jgi:transcription elongation factor S-II
MDVHGSVAGVADAAGREGAFAAVQQVATETGSFDAGPVSTLESAWNTANATEVDGDQQQQQHSDRMQTEPMVSALPLPPGKRGDIVRALTDVFIAAATEEATPTEHVNAATINLCRSLCIELERALNAKFSFDFARPDYSAKYRELKANLRRNADLRWRLLRQELSPAELVDMSAEALKTEQAREREAEIAERMLFHKQRGIPQAASTDQFRCGKCGQRSCTYFQMQTRSADEPMTTFVTCTHCGNRWKC